MKDDNVSYWESLHDKYSGQLRSVGHPELSEEFNELKYRSETATFIEILKDVRPELKKHDSLSIMDLGAGAGYWTDLVHAWFDGKGYQTKLTGLDISEHALRLIKERSPWVEVIHEDLRTIDTDILIIIDPVLSKPFSHITSLDYGSQAFNGIPRPLHLLDDILFDEGLQRWTIRPAVSFVLNGNIEGNGRIGYALCYTTWQIMRKIYRSGILTKMVSGVILKIDEVLKNRNLAFSSSVCVYPEKRRISCSF
jgi:SAM-dependent methyltransferase